MEATEASETSLLKRENAELRTELAAQQAVYQKLKSERDQIWEQLKISNEETRYSNTCYPSPLGGREGKA